MTEDNKKGEANRLIDEKSPYLLQHAYNPVDWYPWSKEAFERAEREDKPVLLSIGYSSCHWCHVMEKEVFEDPSAARAINDAFVSIKVDREERPDIDSLYMSAAHAAGSAGGWPLNVFLAPNKKPFFAATYIPKESRFGQIGVMDLCERISNLWSTRRSELLKTADDIASMLATTAAPDADSAPGADSMKAALDALGQGFDPVHGGFSAAPKFPSPHNLAFLLRAWKRFNDPGALEMARTTLDRMRYGGIYDHIGFGFHRYSTDREWLLPHFEKMLYDQAMLTMAYSEAFQATGEGLYSRTVDETISYVLRDLTSPEGAFYCGEDADSSGVEGAFYVWTEAEIEEILDPEEAAAARRVFGIKPGGNFCDEATGVSSGDNVIHLSGAPEEGLRKVREKLFAAREVRERPALDDKVLTDWNGLMIAALAKASVSTGAPEYAAAAMRAWQFIRERLRKKDGRLLHRYRDGEAAIDAHLDDYAFLVWGLIELYEATFDPALLRAAIELNATMMEDFGDLDGGAFFYTPQERDDLIARQKNFFDNAYPSGNSVAMLNLLRLSSLTGESALAERAAKLSRSFAGMVKLHPQAFCHFLSAVDFAAGPSREVVVAGDPEGEDTLALIAEINKGFRPGKVLLLRPEKPEEGGITEIAPYTRDLKPVGGRAAAYICKNFSCSLPVTDPEKISGLFKD